MPSKKKEIKLKVGKVPSRVVDKFKSMLRQLYDANPEEYITRNLGYTCLGENICLIYNKQHFFPKLLVLYENSWIGLYVKKTLVPSLSLIKEIYKKHGIKAAIIVNEQGVKAFLYGNDILPQSVVKVIPPKLGLYAVVDVSDEEVVGFVRWSSRKRVYKNVYDLGIFLRLLG